jgi:hypothetical protein
MSVSFVVMIVVFILFFNKLPPQIPLFYSLSDGEDAVVDTIFIFVLPVLSILLVTANSILKKKYFKENALLDHIFYYCNLLIIVSTTIIFLRIILLVT